MYIYIYANIFLLSWEICVRLANDIRNPLHPSISTCKTGLGQVSVGLLPMAQTTSFRGFGSQTASDSDRIQAFLDQFHESGFPNVLATLVALLEVLLTLEVS